MLLEQKIAVILIVLVSTASFSRLTIAPMYTATKHAILGLMRCAAFELEPNGIRVAAACPWFVGAFPQLANFCSFQNADNLLKTQRFSLSL